ncbi:MAG: basic amino acid ABC transporter substrate-binding protein [Ruminococcus sp.]|nr:basic amino acid ABC transporter substrate-binding protein [Ruminococcus sp.]
MKKIIALLLVAVLAASSAFVLASCGESGDKAASDSKEELHMATNAFFEPYEYYEGKKVVGIDAEIADAICEKLGCKLVIDDMEFDSIITAVSSGKADFGMAGMTVTDERKKAVDFTDSYTTATQVIIVPEKDAKVSNADDLAKASVGVQLGTTGDIYVSDIKGASVERFSKGADAVLALTKGKVDAVVIDNEPAKAFVEQNDGIKILDEPFEKEDYAICLKKGSDLTAKINKALKELKEDGTIKKIVDKYIGD